MPRVSKFDAEKLRRMIKEEKTANEICDEFDIKKPVLKNYVNKLINQDERFYKIEGMNTRMVMPKVTKLGFKISLSTMTRYGFKEGDEITIQKQDDGAILIKRK